MASDPKTELERILTEGVRKIAPQLTDLRVVLEKPRRPEHGDFTSTAALQLAKPLGMSPREVVEQLRSVTAEAVARTGTWQPLEIVNPGFLNARLTRGTKQSVIGRVLAQGASYGRTTTPQPQRIMVEFVSANPTGPLHVGHGRQAALGGAIAALLESQGHAVTREFYYNDSGAQIHNLALSVQARADSPTPEAPG